MSKPIPPKLQAFLDYVNAGKVPYDVPTVRQQAAALSRHFQLSKVALPFVEDRVSHLMGRDIPVRIYHADPQHVLPVLFYFHGGGHMCGSIETHDALCRRIARATQTVLISVGYRLAPEHPYPAGLQDCIEVVKQRKPLLVGVQADTEKMLLAGDSAGGNLAISVCQALKIEGDQSIQGLMLIYPSVDFTMQHDSIRRNGQGFLLSRDKMQWYFDHYFVEGADRRAASPLYFEHLDQLPPTYIAVAEYDPLRDEAVAFAEKLQHLGVMVELEEFAGMIHVFAQLETVVPDQVDRLSQSIGEFVATFLPNRNN